MPLLFQLFTRILSKIWKHIYQVSLSSCKIAKKKIQCLLVSIEIISKYLQSQIRLQTTGVF